MCRKLYYWIFALLILAVMRHSANPVLMNNMQLFSTLHWYQLENQRLQLLHRMEITGMQRRMDELQELYDEVHQALESTRVELNSARATIQMQTSVIRRLVRED